MGDSDQDQQLTEKPEVTDEHKEKAKEMAELYEDNRPSTVLPGSDGTVAGTAIADWVDDDGNPKYTDSEEKQTQES